MDRGLFDALTRLVASRQSRRAAIAALLGAMLPGHHPAATLARRRKRKQKGHDQEEPSPGAGPCFPGTHCQPTRGGAHAGCDFGVSAALRGRNMRGAVLSGANFTLADLRGADFRGAVLDGACLLGANLAGAVIDETTVLGDAIFCRTIMPDGSLNNSGCEQGTACCPTICQGDDCASCSDYRNDCSVLKSSPCCTTDAICTPSADPLVATCQRRCTTDDECTAIDPDLTCKINVGLCPFIGDCCTAKDCSSDADCQSQLCCSGLCCFGGQKCTDGICRSES